jgi:Do/DeqQ family serine protease
VIISPDGYIITNNHVIDGTDEIEVKLNDNRTFEAKIVGQDPSSDIAVLKIDAKDLSYLKYGDSDNLKVGQWVLAVGNPFNLTSTVTAGIVSAKGRNLSLLTEDYKIESFIQTDAALNPGNSGGALVDTKGLLVGITSAIYSPSGAYSGNSFAIPVSIVKKVVEDLIEYGEVQRALLGVSIREVTPEDASKNKLSQVRGAFVAEIIESGAAKSSDLEVGDIIIKVNGVDIYTITELQEQVGRYRPGDKVSVTYFRDGRERSTQVTLKNIMGTTDVVKPGMGTTAIMGARMETLSRNELRNYRISNGVKIVEINDGRLKDLGLREGSIVISVNGKNVNSAEDVRQATDNGTTLRNIEGIQPNGAYFSYRLTN